MEKRDYRLVIGGKYNMKAIMQRAWVYVRSYNYSLKSAMRMSWADAREKMKDAERELRFHEAVKTNTLFPNKNLSVFDIYNDPCGNLSMGYVTK